MHLVCGGAERGCLVSCRPVGPKAFKQFLLDLPDEVTPQEAQQRYDEYLADYWGSEVRAAWETGVCPNLGESSTALLGRRSAPSHRTHASSSRKAALGLHRVV